MSDENQSRSEDIDFVAREIKRVLEQCLGEHARGRGRVEVQQFDTRPERVSVSLIPDSPAATEITFHLVAGVPEAAILLGRGSIFELGFRDSDYTNTSFIDDVAAFATAVIAGNIEEKVWLKNDEVVKVKTDIVLGGKRISNTGIRGSNPFRRARVQVVKWAPY